MRWSLNLAAQTLDALAVGVLRLSIAQLGLIAHADMPLAKGQPDLRLVERLHAQPLAHTLLA